MLMIQYVQKQDEKDEMIKCFNELDTNNDGVISRSELIQGY